MGPKCTSRLPEAENKAMCWLPSHSDPPFERVSTHGKHMGDSSPMCKLKASEWLKLSEGEPSLQESQRG
ncbi:hypothetical protein TNCV_1644801, partial [Trichonephila clavipes]